MAQIDSPLGDSDVEITFDRPILTPSAIGKSICLIDVPKSYRRADILYSERAISISFTQPLAEARKRLELRVSCEPLDLQMLSMALICKNLFGSALLLGVEDLHLDAKRPPSNGQDDSERKYWLEIIYPFRGTKWVHVAGDHSTNILLALKLSSTNLQEPEGPWVPLQEAASSFTHSRRLTGNFIGLEYEQLIKVDKPRGTGPSAQRTTIESLCDDVLLKIFLHYLEASSKNWPTLVHVCQHWRQTVFTSPRSLNLQLHCKHGTPVSKTLDCWPALPIIVQYGGSSTLDPPSPEDEDNVLAVLKQADRVGCISLTITESLLAKFLSIDKPFLGLEELDLLSQDDAQLTLPSNFQWGPRLRRLRLTRITIPALPQLSSSTGLVDLQLHEIPNAVYISPEAFANTLSGMSRLRSLSLHFFSLRYRDNGSLPPSSWERVFLPSLTCLKYQGTSKYLDCLVARMNAPRLGDVDITFFEQTDLDAWRLGQFIEQIEMRRPLSQADILFSQGAFSIRFSHPGDPTRLGLRIPCGELDWQLPSLTKILTQFSNFLSCVENLGINITEPPSEQVDVGRELWLDLIRAFGGVKYFRVAREVATDILRGLCAADGEHPTVLPALCDIRIRKPLSMHGPLWDAAESFNVSRWRSGRPVLVSAVQYSCHLCDVSAKEQMHLGWHLTIQHKYQFVCPFCADFERSPLSNDYRLHREHLESEHPEVVPIPESTSSPAFGSLITIQAPQSLSW